MVVLRDLAADRPGQAEFGHQPLHRAPGHRNALPVERQPHLTGTVDAVVRRVDPRIWPLSSSSRNFAPTGLAADAARSRSMGRSAHPAWSALRRSTRHPTADHHPSGGPDVRRRTSRLVLWPVELGREESRRRLQNCVGSLQFCVLPPQPLQLRRLLGVVPARAPTSTSAWRTHFRTVSAVPTPSNSRDRVDRRPLRRADRGSRRPSAPPAHAAPAGTSSTTPWHDSNLPNQWSLRTPYTEARVNGRQTSTSSGPASALTRAPECRAPAPRRGSPSRSGSVTDGVPVDDAHLGVSRVHRAR